MGIDPKLRRAPTRMGARERDPTRTAGIYGVDGARTHRVRITVIAAAPYCTRPDRRPAAGRRLLPVPLVLQPAGVAADARRGASRGWPDRIPGPVSRCPAGVQPDYDIVPALRRALPRPRRRQRVPEDR